MSIFIAGEGKSSGHTFHVHRDRIQSFINMTQYLSISQQAFNECKSTRKRKICFHCNTTKDTWTVDFSEFKTNCFEDEKGRMALPIEYWEWNFHRTVEYVQDEW